MSDDSSRSRRNIADVRRRLTALAETIEAEIGDEAPTLELVGWLHYCLAIARDDRLDEMLEELVEAGADEAWIADETAEIEEQFTGLIAELDSIADAIDERGPA